MGRPVELIPLVCFKCSTALPAEPDEVAWVCGQCGQGLQLDEAKGLAPLEIQYAAGIAPNAQGRPFWVVDGQVALKRETYSGNQGRDAEQFWGAGRRFFVPAFNCSLNDLLMLGQQMLTAPPNLQPGQRAAFVPVTLSPGDIQSFAEFIVVAIEAGRKDQMKQIQFTLTLSAPALWILP